MQGRVETTTSSPGARWSHRAIELAMLMVLLMAGASEAEGQSLEDELRARDVADVAADAREFGDPRRGAVVFYQQHLSCTRCHLANDGENTLGPDLTKLGPEISDEHLVESVLSPSKVIREGYEPVTVVSARGEVATGLLVSSDDREVVIRDAGKNFQETRFARKDVVSEQRQTVSVMPAGQMNTLHSRQQFLDLISYLRAIRDGGADKAQELEPSPDLYAAGPLPEYESRVDHAGIISTLDREAFERGEKIYSRICVNCHGTQDAPGSLPTSLKFASGQFKNGSDPYSMYRTLTSGFGTMVAQTWMVPTQKYDVIHYIREAYLAPRNRSQYFEVDAAYLAGLPKGDTRGPAPSTIEAWEQMDYGPNLMLTLEVGQDGSNFAYKGHAIRLDRGPGGVTRGRYWILYDHDTMRVAAAWSGKSFIDFNGINFNGRHAIHPRVVGEIHLANPTGPGWGRPGEASFEDPRLEGRDGRLYGPLPRDWARYSGTYHHGADTIVRYTVGSADVLERPGIVTATPQPVFLRAFDVGARDEDLVLQVAHRGEPGVRLDARGAVAVFESAPAVDTAEVDDATRFDGETRLEVRELEGLHVDDGDFTVVARIRTEEDGTILAQTSDVPRWVPDGLTFFVRGGRLAVDIGWVGAFQGEARVADGKWHTVGLAYSRESGAIRFAVDGRVDGRVGTLRRKGSLEKPLVRIGYTAPNFPRPSGLRGRIAELRYYNAAAPVRRLEALTRGSGEAVAQWDALAASWDLSDVDGDLITDRTRAGRGARRIAGAPTEEAHAAGAVTVAGLLGEAEGLEWVADGANLRLRIPAGADRRRFTLWFASVEERDTVDALVAAVAIDDPTADLRALTTGGPPRWRDVLTTKARIGEAKGPFAIDVLTHPVDNPWFCRLRLGGFDFTADGDSLYVGAWDGSVWRVDGLKRLEAAAAAGEKEVDITWRRIASGLFQPLGLKVVEGKIYVTCRDQICVLHDVDGDGEVDWYENFNNDHQVTDHFHEFAMGLQVDDEGNFYYAKSARHALTALVPHHGTLLRVSKDGSRTDILANGFRAANGVCLNPDGTFIVTDQEGHWNPKNRINYVKVGGFYGNMFGYHDVTDPSDDAMEQPLCWITNAFDRSPAELLWVDSERWGPLDGQLLNLSYGYGKVYVVPHETIDGQQQGGMCELPIPQFPTGVMRGRFHPGDGQLYLCGLSAWASSQTQPGGLYRLRYTGKPVFLPEALEAKRSGMRVRFTGALDPETATDAKRYRVKVWGLERTANYGSRHVDEHEIAVTGAQLEADGRTVRLEIPEIAPTWSMEIHYRLRAASGAPFEGKIHNTIHVLAE